MVNARRGRSGSILSLLLVAVLQRNHPCKVALAPKPGYGGRHMGIGFYKPVTPSVGSCLVVTSSLYKNYKWKETRRVMGREKRM